MKLLRSSTPWLISLVCGVGLVAAVGYGQRVAQNKPAATPAAATVTELSSIFRDVSKQVLPAVVSLRVKQKDPAEGGREDVEKFFEQNPDLPERFRDFYRRRRGGPGGFPPGGSQGMGSGSIIDAKGIILTNYHVIKDAQARLDAGRG